VKAPPPVQYATTSDGYDIAFTVQGAGHPLVCLPFAFSHAQQVWGASSASPLLQALSERFRVVYYDGRGQGLSQRGLALNTTVDSFLLDLQAVMEALRLDRPVILGDGYLSHVAVRFAVEAPRRVAALALMHCAVSFADHIAGLYGLAKANWDYFLSIWAGSAVPKPQDETQHLPGRVEGLKDRTTQADMLRTLSAFETSDISDALTRLRIPAMVLHPSHQQWVNQESSARSAALIPNGRLVVLSGAEFFGDEEAAAAIESLVGEAGAESSAGVRSAPARGPELSLREVEVLRLLAAGKSNQQIAEDLVISLNTVTRHVSHIYAKTGAVNRAQAAVFARDRGLV
jgi:DNA-binding CsgD family transcriptional regulator/pimeloyl-ACP methyl ester carboxylesterase